MSEARPLSRVSKIIISITIALLLVVAVGTVRMAFYGDQQKNEKETAQAGVVAEKQEKKDLAAEVDRICATKTAEATNLRKRGKCEQAKEIIKEPITVEGQKGDKGDPPSDSQVQAAVDIYCASGRCNGKSPSPQQVAAAVAMYCNARGQCTPPKPKDGAKGEAGENATSEQVAAAVASFCSGNNCDGKDGNNGTNGTNGTNGRSVSISVADIDGGKRLTVNYSDDTPSVSFDVMNGLPGEPGKVGPPGPAGPACPTGYHLELRHVVSTEAPTGEESQVCIKDQENP